MKKKVTTLYQDPTSYNKKIIKKDYYNLINNFIKTKKVKRVLDIGCASGDFAYYLPKKINYLGLDINTKLISKARKNNKKNILKKFKKINLFDCDNFTFLKIKKKNSLKNFDLITLFGTLTSFSNAKTVIKRLLSLKPKFLLLHSHFNEKINSSIKFAYVNNKKVIKGEIHLISKDFLIKMLSPKYQIKFKKYELKNKLKKNDKDLIRNYHIDFKNNKNLTTNDIGVLYHEYLVYIQNNE